MSHPYVSCVKCRMQLSAIEMTKRGWVRHRCASGKVEPLEPKRPRPPKSDGASQTCVTSPLAGAQSSGVSSILLMSASILSAFFWFSSSISWRYFSVVEMDL